MPIERIFGMLKGRFSILLKRINNPLCRMLDLVMACICLHNMCIANSNGFDMDWALEAQRKAQAEANSTFGHIKRVDLFKVAKKTIKQM
jgi:hypothetical protein